MCVCNYSGLGHRSSEFGGNPDLHLSTCSYEISLILPRVLSLCSCRRPLLSCCPAATGRTEKPITNYHLPFTIYQLPILSGNLQNGFCTVLHAGDSPPMTLVLRETDDPSGKWHMVFINQSYMCVLLIKHPSFPGTNLSSVQKKKRKNQRPILLFRRQSAVIIWYDFWYPLVLPIPR